MMASQTDVFEALTILSGAKLRGAPTKDETAQVAGTWARVMRDIPAAALVRAVEDHILVNEFWPTPAAIRKAAAAVRAHNYTSAAANPFKDDSNKRSPVPGVYHITSDGAQPVYLEDLHPRPPQHPPEVMEAIAALEAKYYDGGLPTDDELAEIDRMIAGEGVAV